MDKLPTSIIVINDKLLCMECKNILNILFYLDNENNGIFYDGNWFHCGGDIYHSSIKSPIYQYVFLHGDFVSIMYSH